MKNLTIFCDYSLDPAALQLLQDGVAPHRLVLPQPGTDSVFAQADIAFGQPDVASILASTRLRWAHISSAGFTRYDTPEFRAAAKSRGLRVTNSSSVYAEPCAEHVLSFMLAQARQLPVALRACIDYGCDAWGKLRARSSCLTGQSVVILGFGSIGARLVELLAPFQMKISAMSRNTAESTRPSVVPC